MTAGGDQDSKIVAKWTLPVTKGVQSLVLVPDSKLDALADDEGGVPGTVKPGVVPGSDGAGVVEAIGSKVTKFGPGDRVVTHLSPSVPDNAAPTMEDISAGLGHSIDGTLRGRGNFHESALVHAPRNNSFAQAATLTCSGLTAWNAVFGLKGREARAGDWVLVQGTGGVSVAALQFAVAAGAHIVATMSNREKAKLLEDWEHTMSSTTASTGSGREFDLIVDVGGNSTLPQSLDAVRTDGIVVLTEILGGAEQPVAMLSALDHACTVRGILLGSNQQFCEMVQSVEEQNLQSSVLLSPVVRVKMDLVISLEWFASCQS